MNTKKLTRPDYKRMYEVMVNSLLGNLGRLVLYVFLFEVVSSLLYSAGLVPLAVSKATLASGTIAFVLLFVLNVAIMSIFAGLVKIASRISRRMPYSSSFMFSNFGRNSDKRVFLGGILWTLIYAVSIGVVFFIMTIHKEYVAEIMTDALKAMDGAEAFDSFAATRAMNMILVFTVIFFAIVMLMSIPFIFIWNILEDEKNIPFFAAVKKSLFLIRRNYFHYIGFNIYCGLKNIVFIAVIALIQFTMPNFSGNTLVSIILSFCLFIQQYTLISKVILAIPIYYYSILSVNGILPEGLRSENSDRTSQE